MYKRVLVAVDGSPISIQALQEAAKLSKTCQAQLRIVTVIETVMLAGGAEYVDFNEVRKAAVNFGQDVLNKAGQRAKETGVEAESRLIEIERAGDRVTDMISKEADEWPADLIVIGTHGRRGFNHLLMGSVAEGVVRIASKPVLLIRGK